jgi:hypothetical protein
MGDKIVFRKAFLDSSADVRRQFRSRFVTESLRGKIFSAPVDLKIPGFQDVTPTKVRICLTGFLTLTGISKNSIYYHPKGSSSPRLPNPDTLLVRSWILETQKRYGPSPVSDHVYAPYSNKVAIYKLFCVEFPNSKVSKTTFFRVWNSKECRFLRVRKWSPFAKCDTCTRLKSCREQATTAEAREQFITLLTTHEKMFRAERELYLDRVRDARANPDHFLSMIVDGADQTQFNIPHFVQKSTSIQNASTIPIQLLGIFFCFFVPLSRLSYIFFIFTSSMTV